MEYYCKSTHTVYDLKYHFVWVEKYRKPVLCVEIAERVRDLIREICKANDVEIIKGNVSRNNVHIFVSMPPHISVSRMVQRLKGKTSRKLLMEYLSLSRAFWGRHMWARGYFAGSSGNVTDEVIMKYIEQQGNEPPDGDFNIED